MLLLRGGASPSSTTDEISPAELQAYLAPYLRWLAELEQSGSLLHARRLAATGSVVLRPRGDAVVVLDGPYTESKDIVGGYYLIAAATHQEAEAIARRCPHLDNGGAVELRRVAD
jgi:hypothetical protein